MTERGKGNEMRRRLYLVAAVALGLAMLTGGRASAQAKIINDPSVFEPTFASDPQGAIKAARERIAAGDLAGAVKVLQSTSSRIRARPVPERFLGDLYYRQGRFDKAEEVYQHILAHNPGDRETHNRLGVVYATQNRVDDAIDQFNKALPGTDSVADSRRDARAQGRPSGVSQADGNASPTRSRRTPTFKPRSARSWRRCTSRPTRSDTSCARSTPIRSRSTALNGLGLAYFDLHNYTEAEKDFQRLLAIDATNYTCTNNFGAAYLQAGDDESAKPFLMRAHSLAPERPEALVNFGFLADRRGDWKRAVDFYVQATVVGPYLPEAYIDLGIDYEHNGLYQLAQSALLKGIAAAPEDGRIRYLLARRVRVARTKDARARPA